ncbi:MAG: rhodanese [Pseudomonadota bacterium]
MESYLVGGAVRDRLLELPVYDRDWVVVGASEAEMLAAGYQRAAADFPVFIHPETGEEYALARTEEKVGPGYKGFRIYAGTDVTLEQDLLRRDLTINALAMDAEGRLIDVCKGREDLAEGLLRHITPAFVEDPVRLLRIARFAAKLGQWGFRVAHGTQGLMRKMAAGDDLRALTQERVFQELWKAMGETQPWRFFEVLQDCGALQRLLPELSSVMGTQESHQSVREDGGMTALKRVAKLSDDPGVRFAVLMYLAAQQAEDVDRFIAGLRVEKQTRVKLKDLLELAPLVENGPQPGQSLQIIKQLKPETQPQRFNAFVLAAHALWPGHAVEIENRLQIACEVVESIDVSALRAQGLEGRALGAALLERQLAEMNEKLAGIS